MAKQRKPKMYVSKVNEKVGSNEDGSPRLVFEIGKPVKGLSSEQAKYFKSKNFI